MSEYLLALCFVCVSQPSCRNLADSISPKEIIDLTANWLASPRAWWRVAKSISSHDKPGNSWSLLAGHDIHYSILIKIIAPILLYISKNPTHNIVIWRAVHKYIFCNLTHLERFPESLPKASIYRQPYCTSFYQLYVLGNIRLLCEL